MDAPATSAAVSTSEAPAVLAEICDSYQEVGVTKLGGMIRSFRRRGAGRIVMAGKVTKGVMYTPMRIVRLWPDYRMFRMWYGALRADKRDDSILLGVIAEFERELTVERIRSGIAAAKARGKKLGRQPGQRPKSDRLASKVLALVAQGRSYRLVGRELGLSKNTVAGIVKRNGGISACA